MGEEDLSLSVLSTSAPRGGKFTVKVTGGRSDYRGVRVELLLVERKVKSQMDGKRNNAIVVNKVDVPEATDIVEVSVPWHLPNAYEGETIAWDYELRVVGDKLGRDHHDEMAVTIAPNVPVELKGSGVTLQSSKATGLLRVGQPRSKSLSSSALWSVGAGVVAMLVGLAASSMTFVIAGGLMLVFGAYSAWSAWKYKGSNLDDVPFDVPQRTNRLGEPVTVTVGGISSKSLEVGLLAVEYLIVHGKNSDTAASHRVHEHFLPVMGRSLQLATSASAPSGYPGTEVALHWMVALREAGVPEKQQNFTMRLIPIGLTH